jgi:hypothetical protein
MKYIVKRTNKSFEPDCRWDKEFWQNAEPLELKNYMRARPEPFPKTQAKLLYDEKFVYVIFRVEDRYLRAVAEKLNDNVFQDSCVEFFFTPSSDISAGYFNIEINCIGTMLMHYQSEKDKNRIFVDVANAEQIKRCASLSGPIAQEIAEPVSWTLEYCVPIDMLKKYTEVENPAPGIIWPANLYKCADKTSRPHWLTWSPIELPEPDFHQPKFFGTLEFE